MIRRCITIWPSSPSFRVSVDLLPVFPGRQFRCRSFPAVSSKKLAAAGERARTQEGSAAELIGLARALLPLPSTSGVYGGMISRRLGGDLFSPVNA